MEFWRLVAADLLFLLHVAIVIFCITSPFSKNPAVLLLGFAALLSILTHWASNNDICCLTVAESWLRGVKKTDTFIDSIVSPVYAPPSSKTVWNITALLLGITIGRIYQNPQQLKTLIKG
jgi:hypothetical protein